MHFLRLKSIALAAVSVQAAVLPRQEATSSSVASLPNTSAPAKSYLTSITSLPMPSSVEGNTAYPPSTTSIAATPEAQTSTLSTVTSRPPFTWDRSAAETNSTTSTAFATGVSSAANVTAIDIDSTISSISASISSLTSSLLNTTAVVTSTPLPNNGTTTNNVGPTAALAGTAADQTVSPSSGPYANSTSGGLVGGVAATGTAVQVTGISVASGTGSPSTPSANNSTTAARAASTSLLVQMYLSRPSALDNKAKTTEVPLGSNMTLIVEDDDDEESSDSAAQATLAPSSSASVALFANGTTSSGVAKATSTGISAASNTTLASVTVKATAAPSSNSTVAATTSTPSSSPPVANAVDNNGTMFAVTYDNKNGTMIQLVSASNATKPLSATGTAAPSASASADLSRRDVDSSDDAPITPAAADKGSWTKGFPGFAYSRTEKASRPSRFFSGEGWSLGRRA